MGVRLPQVLPLTLLSKIGLASYPLYLLHQNIGVSVISSVDFPGTSAVMAIFILALLIVLTLLSYAIHRWVEEPGKNILMIPQRLRVSAKTA